MKEYQTNIEFVTDMMKFSQADELKKTFVIEAIRVYSKQTLAAESWGACSLLNQDAWKRCAQECLDSINNRV